VVNRALNQPSEPFTIIECGTVQPNLNAITVAITATTTFTKATIHMYMHIIISITYGHTIQS